MTTSRKIQADIDRTLKKVHEGVDIFEELWDKVHEATTHVQKERQENELKKEIKKLQRLREQIKAWQLSSEIKDKKPINDARRLIEAKMEAFKVCERETKTKAYSKEGLALPNRADPSELAKSQTVSWVNQCIKSMGDRIAELEIETEATNTRRKKTAQNPSPEAQMERHKWHTLKLEQILRMIDNGEIDPTDVDDIRDDVEGYIQAKGSMDSSEEEIIYDTLDLPSIDSLGLSPSAPSLSKKEKTVDEIPVKEKKPVKEEKRKEATAKAKEANAPKSGCETPTSTHVQPAVVKTLAPSTSGTVKVTVDPKSTAVASKTPIERSVAQPASPIDGPDKAKTDSEGPAPVEAASHSPLQLLEMSYQNLPSRESCEFQSLHSPRNPTQTPTVFPQWPANVVNSFETFAQFELDTLFFVFYYEQGTYRHYLASAELKRRGWGFDGQTKRWSMPDSTWEWEGAWGLKQC